MRNRTFDLYNWSCKSYIFSNIVTFTSITYTHFNITPTHFH